jgi:endonuclease YncB( thermonuclease family)
MGLAQAKEAAQTRDMPRSCLLLLLIGLLTAQGVSPAVALAEISRATVLSIGDGDTIRVQQGMQKLTVRLACIDAPEMAQAPYGQQARSYLQQRLAIGREVTLQTQTIDKYGRSVAEVISDININLAMVEDGQAFVYRKYLGQCDAREYLDAEYRASRHRYGVWQQEGGIIRPWDFRRGRRGGASPNGSTSPQSSSPSGHNYRCKEIGSYAGAQELLRQGHTYLDGNGDGVACESLR